MSALARRLENRTSPFVSAWVAAGAGQEPGPLLAAAARRLAIRRGLDPERLAPLCGEPARDVGLEQLPEPASVDELGALHEALLVDPARRKAQGSFYTPPALAEALVEVTLGPLLADPTEDPTRLRIADPACGAGVFLLRALRRLRAAAPEADARSLAVCIAGVDRDPQAAAVCRAALWLELADRDLPTDLVAARILVGDALLGLPADLLPPGSATDREARDRALRTWFGAADPGALRPLHWELAFPEVAAGFDAVLGNPPWDVDKPDARAFFGRLDPAHRELRKQDALRIQRARCAADPALAAAWRDERGLAAARLRFCRARFALQADRGDPNTYQRFVELGLELLREGGRLGMLVPAGLYADLGSRPLRRALLDAHRLERLCGFENRGGLFPGVDSRFKLAALLVAKGGRTTTVETRFMCREAADLRRPGTPIPVARIDRLSPRSRAFVELDDPRALALLEDLHRRGVGFDDPCWSIGLRREFDMTLDSARFVTPAETAGLEAPLPLWEGRMIDGYDGAAKAWVRGHGRRAVWQDLAWPDKRIGPQFLVERRELERVDPEPDRPKVGFMAIGSATNARTMIATLLWHAPCGNSVPTLRCRPGRDGTPGEFALCAVLNSTTYDWALRARLAGNNLNRFVLGETPLPPPEPLLSIRGLPAAVASLAWALPWFDDAWAWLPAAERPLAAPLREPGARRRCRAALDAVVAAAYGLGPDDLAFVLRDTDLPAEELAARARAGRLDPKGLWRVDRRLPPAERATRLALEDLTRLDAELRAGAGLGAAAARLLAAAASQTGLAAR
jgi:hypothetical protein